MKNHFLIALVPGLLAITNLGLAAPSATATTLSYGSYRIYGQYQQTINGAVQNFSMVTTRNPDMLILVVYGTQEQQTRMIEGGSLKCGPLSSDMLATLQTMEKWSTAYLALPRDPAWSTSNKSGAELSFVELIRGHAAQIVEWIHVGRNFPAYGCAGIQSKEKHD